MMIRRSCGAVGLLAVVLMLAPNPAEAQVEDRNVQITAWGGPYIALGKLGSITQTVAPIGETSLKGGFGLGGNVEVSIPVERLSVRGDFSVVPSAEMQTEIIRRCPLASGFTDFENRCRAESEGTLWMGTVDLVYRTEREISRPHGIFTIGLGLKRYSFPKDEISMRDASGNVVFTGACEEGDRVCAFHEDFAGTVTDPTVHLGFGLSTTVGPVNLVGEVSDHLSIYTHESEGRELEELVHDIFLRVSAGIRIL